MNVRQKKGDVKTTEFWPTATSATLPVHLVLLLVWPLLCLLQRSLSLSCQLLQNPFLSQMVTSPISRAVLHSSHCAVSRWHPTSDTRRSPAGDPHSRLFLSLINCYGLASRLSVVLSVFCSLASVTRFTRWDRHFPKASGVYLNQTVFFSPRLCTFSDIFTIPLYFQEQTAEIPLLPGCRWSSGWSLCCKRNSVMW